MGFSPWLLRASCRNGGLIFRRGDGGGRNIRPGMSPPPQTSKPVPLPSGVRKSISTPAPSWLLAVESVLEVASLRRGGRPPLWLRPWPASAALSSSTGSVNRAPQGIIDRGLANGSEGVVVGWRRRRIFPPTTTRCRGKASGGGQPALWLFPVPTEDNIFIASFEPRSSVEAAWSEPWKRAPMRALAWDESTGSSE